MLYREDYYNEDCDPDTKDTLEVNVIKHRNGGIGKITVSFDKSRMRFGDIDHSNRQAGF